MFSSVRSAAATTLRSSSLASSTGGIFHRACRSVCGTSLSGGPSASSASPEKHVSEERNNQIILWRQPLQQQQKQQQQYRSIMTYVTRRPIGEGLVDLTASLATLGLNVSASPAAAAAGASAVSASSPGPAATSAIQRRTFATKRFHHKKIVKAAKGYRGQANRNFRAAIKRVERARQNAYRDRKLRRREFRKLWIQRLNAGVRQHGVRYSRFINMLNGSEVNLDRKILSELAMHEPFSFKAVVDVVKSRSS